jgi:hypothetical protein
MANSIFPDTDSAGGVIVRDIAGLPVTQDEVNNAYIPLQPFVMTCDMAALPSNCEARIEPRQINAIVSELVSFAECLDADGAWDCNSLKNLCAAFTTWAETNLVIFVTPPELTGDGFNTPLTFTGITIAANSSAALHGKGLSTDPLDLVEIDGGTY